VNIEATKEDARRMRIAPTAKGEKVMWEGRRRRVEMLAELLAGLSAEEIQQMGDIAEMMDRISRKI
jgi:DNA-binding MarR family transcriptional regulator